MRRSTDVMLFASWLGLGTTIELLGYHLGLYRFVHLALPFLVAIVLFGAAAPLMQKMLGRRSLTFAALLFASAAAIEFTNATWLHWWTFHEKIRQTFPNDWLLAVGTSSPLFVIAWLMSFGFRPESQVATLAPDLGLLHGLRVPERRAVVLSAICAVLLVALGRYGNAEYVLRPLGIGYLAPTAPLEPRPPSGAVNVDTAVILFSLQVSLILLAILLAMRWCKLTAAQLGFGLGRLSLRQGLPLLLFLCAAPLPGFVIAGLDPHMSTNYPFVQSFPNVTSFVVYEFGYLLFFLTVEALFRSLLFLGFASVTEPTATPGESEPRAHIVFAGILSCLCYVVWHLGKPLPELVGAIVWGPVACAVIWSTRNIMFLVIPHWLWNLVLDAFVTLKRIGWFGS